MAETPARAESHEQLIRDVPLLARLSSDDVRTLAQRGRVRNYSSGSVLFHEGEPGDSLHVVVEGRIRVAVVSPTGEEATVAYIGPGDCFGEFSIFDGRPRSATGIASEKTKTFVVTRDSFVEWLMERPQAALALLETLSLRLRRADESLADLAFLDLPHRLAKQLILLSAQHGERVNGGEPRLRVTQGELASMLAVSRESVNKQLNYFQREGWISLGRGWVRIIDAEALRRFS
jgi:CRP/FNR family transcriptional regulator/CRP/FNR family cyclic AMP-dependent transcriptional regulator